MNNKGEHVLLYQFADQVRLEAVTRLLHHMNIRVTVLPDEAWKEAGLSPVLYKAVVTPFNTLWTLKRLCQTMEKEHGAVTKSISEHEEQEALSEDVIDE